MSSRVYADDPATGRRRDLTVEEERAFWAWAIVEVLRHTGLRIEEALELAHHSFVAYQLPTTGEIVPMLQVAPSKLDQERLLLVSPELGEVLTAIIHRVRRGQQAMPLDSALRIRSRTAASTPGALRVLTWDLSSPKTTSRTQWTVFSTVQCPRAHDAISAAFASSAVRSVMA